MASISRKRKEALLFRAVSQIITEDINNANVSYPTVTGVKLSNDESILKVYLSFEQHKLKSLENLNRAKGFIKSQIAKKVSLKRIPQVHLEIDKSIEEGNRIEEIIRKLNEDK